MIIIVANRMMMGNKIAFIWMASLALIFTGCGEATDDESVVEEKTSVDIAGEFSYSNDLPRGLTFDGFNFWVSADATSKLVAYDTLTGMMNTNWGRTGGSRGLYFSHDSLYQTGAEVRYEGELTYKDVFLYSLPIAGGDTEKLFSFSGLEFAAFPDQLVYDPSSNIFLVSVQTGHPDGPPTYEIWSFDPATGELLSVFWEGRVSGITVHNSAVWIVEEITTNLTYQIRKLSTAGASLEVFDIAPGDGGLNSGGSVEGIAFLGAELWYLNGVLTLIVKSDIVD